LAEQSLQQFAENITKGGNGGLRRKIKQLLKAMETSGEGYAKDHYGDNGLGIITGHLRNSISFKALTSGQILGVMGTSGIKIELDYAAVHEFGDASLGIRARPYISPAMEYLRAQVGPDFNKIFRSSVLNQGFR
tara:strand:+ start:558 stop:959 length:402 start_codon:yes stop_codon:yes gene_type:complete